MNKKTLFIFILVIILFAGGFFLFSSGGNIFKNNRLLATIKEFLPLGKSEESPSSLVLLEQELRGKYELLQKESTNQIDDLSEKVDLLDQKINELETQIQTLGILVSEKENEEETELENQETEENKTTDSENEPVICPKTTGDSALRNKVIFNEIAWMGTTASASNEWMELKNISGGNINLSGWQILDKNNNIKIFFGDSDNISVGGFYLLERGEESINSIKADKIYTGSLANENETLYFFDQNCQIQDIVSAEPDWPAGDNLTKRTMERKSDLNWQTSSNAGGTPKAENSNGYIAVASGGGGGGSSSSGQQNKPKITLSYLKDSPINKEIEVNLSISDLSDKIYDVKISIETEGEILSDIYNLKENKWQSSLYYLSSVFSGTSFNSSFRLKVKDTFKDFRGEADILVKIRENGKTTYNEYSDKINIIEPEKEPNKQPVAFFVFSPQNPSINESITLDASSSVDSDGQIVSYIWDFGDGNSITTDQAVIDYSYFISSEFTISLKVIDNEGLESDLFTSAIFIKEPEMPISELDVVINEIAWMGTKASSADEWIELYNNTSQEIDLTDWKIYEGGGTTLITVLKNKIDPRSYYLIERSDDDTVFDITADIFGPFGGSGLNDSGEYLVLKDNKENLIDEVDASGGWFTIKKTEKPSMERINPKISGNLVNNWAENNGLIRNGLDADGNPLNATPKSQNSVFRP